MRIMIGCARLLARALMQVTWALDSTGDPDAHAAYIAAQYAFVELELMTQRRRA